MTEKCTCNSRPAGERLQLAPLPSGLRRSLRFEPGFKCELPSGSPRGHGVNGMAIVFCVSGQKGEVTWDFNVSQLRPGGIVGKHCEDYLSGGPIGYHTPNPQYEDQPPRDMRCESFGGPCYTDGGFIAGSDLARAFADHGADVVWAKLAERYEAIEFPQAANADFIELEDA